MSCNDLIQSLITKEVISSLCYVLAGVFFILFSIYLAKKTIKLYKEEVDFVFIPIGLSSTAIFFIGIGFLIYNVPSVFAPKAAVYEEHQKDIPTQCLFTK